MTNFNRIKAWNRMNWHLVNITKFLLYGLKIIWIEYLVLSFLEFFQYFVIFTGKGSQALPRQSTWRTSMALGSFKELSRVWASWRDAPPRGTDNLSLYGHTWPRRTISRRLWPRTITTGWWTRGFCVALLRTMSYTLTPPDLSTKCLTSQK